MSRRVLLSAVALLELLVSLVGAEVPTHPIDGSYVKEWLVIGPFPSADLGTDFLAGVGGEAHAAPREGDQVVTVEGDTLVWRRYATRQDVVDLGEALGDHEQATAYAYCVLQSETAGEVGLDFRSLNIDDAVELWLNGEWFGLEVEAGANGCLLKISHGSGRWGFALRLYPPDRAVLAGAVTDAASEPVAYADMRLEREGAVVAEWQTDYWGEYDEVNVYPADGAYDLSVTAGELGTWELGLEVLPGNRLSLTHEIEGAVSISGTLLMLDGVTPHVAVPVQALRLASEGAEVAATVLSDEGGRYQFVNLKPGRYLVRCHTMDGHVYYASSAAGSPPVRSPEQGTPLQIGSAAELAGVDFHLAPFKKGVWHTYSTRHGLADNLVYAVQGSPDGDLWVSTRNSVSRFDGTNFTSVFAEDELKTHWFQTLEISPEGTLWGGSEFGFYSYDGTDFVQLEALANTSILDIDIARDGAVWIATHRGVFRHDGHSASGARVGLVEPLEKLVGIRSTAVHCEDDGALWVGTDRGVFRYDGQAWHHLTTADGLAADYVTVINRDADGVLWFGTVAGISRYDPRSGTWATLTTADGLVNDFVNDIHIADEGVVWIATDGGVARYDNGSCPDADESCDLFVNYTTADGLAEDFVFDIYEDLEGQLWFATELGGVSRYDSRTFVHFTARDGLVTKHIQGAAIDSNGVMWFGTGFSVGSGNGVYRYDGESFVNFTTADGLADNSIRHVDICPDGTVWFGTMSRGVSRYDGQRFETLSVADGLLGDFVESVYCDSDGVVWFGSGENPGISAGRAGVTRYDGEEFTYITTEDGLAAGTVFNILRDSNGIMWFGSGLVSVKESADGQPGLSRYDGESVVNWSAAHGFSTFGTAIHEDADGTMWFVIGGGIVSYDGQSFTHFTKDDGVLSNNVINFHRARDGILWAGSNGGVMGYDGKSWTVIDTRDGLASDEVWRIFEDGEGLLWFCTTKGPTQYRRSTTAPDVVIDYVQTDAGRHSALAALPSVSTGQRVTFGYRAIDFKTLPDKRQYRYRIKELDEDWRKPTRATTFEWEPEWAGTYTFEVQAIDRDLRYSESDSVKIEVTPQYGQIALWGSVVVLSIGLVLAGGYGLSRRRERDQLREQLVGELEREMQTAHELQMSLMPIEAPQIPGIEVAGQCIPATDVGGDIFQYFAQDGKFAVAVADVTGHGMQAAVPVMMFSGILEMAMRLGPPLEALFADLNRSLHERLEKRTFICFAMGELSLDTRLLRLANVGCPPFYHYRAATGEVVELEGGGYPLGVRAAARYEVTEVALAPGDRIALFSDGLVEAANGAGEFFGFDRIAAVIGEGCGEGLSAENLLQRVFGEVRAFCGAVPQDDDQTLVVLQVGL